ncbi:GTP-binding protein [Paractinoplanes lichenicola]|uniref:TetM/TetW/TetO/TetS family tetracycline resistance ribosomal protection protein n=1 Tax=Paractinoplanes lichenicola TaxID=2802976 RepID=A0ABS1VTM1_9ACTN|nr:GTP-binding protein [Actinoplanes lichenicola]MBL7257802.1 TetM/TetW/TetO/TetS family tetracycline resistance ribosomal protection protein [Actinoplanes lichenicola]
MALLNLGIVAHVDAGKTSLTERLLLAAGVTDTLGSVDAGSTRTDSLELERRRGITIKSAVVSLRLRGMTVNLIDTPGHPDFIAEVERVLGVLDDAVLRALVAEREPRPPQVRGRVHPVYFGSAITGAGVDDLISGITALRPAPETRDGGTVFKVERGPGGERLAYVRMFAGELRVRDVVAGERVTGVEVFDGGGTVVRPVLRAGEIGRVRGLSKIKIGDGVRGGKAHQAQFAPPSLETAVVAARPQQRGALHAALTELAEQDPLIALRQDEARHELHVSLYGEVQKEVIQATLAEQYGLEVVFRPTVTVCVERPAGCGEAFEVIGVAPNPFLATVGLRVEPGAGTFGLGVEPGSMPAAFFKAVEETVHETLRQGLRGWPVTGYHVTLTRSGYWARQSHAHAVFDKSMSSTAGDFRSLTPLVLMAALRAAGTSVLEPVHAFRAELPADTLPQVLPVLARLGGIPLNTTPPLLEGHLPAGSVHDFQRRLPGLTRGEGVLESAFDHYEPVRGGPLPTRARTDHNPLDRKEYLLRVVRRTGG